ncbi:MAG: AtpZ/AtpI family protein [Bacteroidota bacterium]|jgi:hypothetical protein
MKKPSNPLNNYAKYSSIALQMLVIIAGGVVGGYYLDKWIGIKFPVFTVLFSFLSVSLAIYISIKDFLKK